MRLRMYILLLTGACWMAATALPSLISTHEPIPFVLEKTAQNDVVMLGTTHQQAKILNFLSDLVPHLSRSGVTHIGLEIESDQQPRLDRWMKTGTGLSDIRIFPGIDCPEYRRLLDRVRKNRLTPVALDLPKSMWQDRLTRDQWMAHRIAEVFQQNGAAKMLVIVGSLHTVKRVDWASPAIKDQFARYYLDRIHPKLRLYSVASSINESVDDCDFQKWFGRDSGPVGIETLVFDRTLGFTRTLAAGPITAKEAVDAVIVF